MYVAWEQLKEDNSKGVYVVPYTIDIPKNLKHLECIPIDNGAWQYVKSGKKFIPDEW